MNSYSVSSYPTKYALKHLPILIVIVCCSSVLFRRWIEKNDLLANKKSQCVGMHAYKDSIGFSNYLVRVEMNDLHANKESECDTMHAYIDGIGFSNCLMINVAAT